MKERSIAFVNKDISTDAQARKELETKYGRLATPTIVIDEKVFVGFKENLKEIERLIG
ncbi:MAG: glutaredoxin family protein [Nitrospirae bacterium]|nr:MAG: glutaredoxin family protein [Nitrospirota bacterium]